MNIKIKIILKQFILYITVLFLVFQGVIGSSSEVIACTTPEECQNAIVDAQKKRAELTKKQHDLENKSKDTKSKIENISEQIDTYQTELSFLDIEMTNLGAQKKQLEKNIGDNDKIIKQRLLSMQLSMETNAELQFLASASSISEMIERMQTMGDLTELNQEVIQMLENQRTELTQNEKSQEVRKSHIDQLLVEQAKLRETQKIELEQYDGAAQNTARLQEKVTKELGISQQQFSDIEAERKAAKASEKIQIEEAKKNSNTAQTKPTVELPIPTTPIPSNGTALQNEKIAFQYFVNQGYTRESAAAIIGNFYVESGMDPMKKQYFGGPGRGLAQWGYNQDGGRFNDLINWSRNQGKSEWALDTQLAWTIHELNTYGWFRKMNKALKSTNDISYATYYFGEVFEGPADLSASINTRVDFANKVYNRN